MKGPMNVVIISPSTTYPVVPFDFEAVLLVLGYNGEHGRRHSPGLCDSGGRLCRHLLLDLLDAEQESSRPG